MSWELKWEGRATDFIPDLLSVSGKPGAVAQLAKEALWECVQRAGERNVGAWVSVRARGIEDRDEPGSGELTIEMQVCEDVPETPVQRQLREQQPVDLLKSRGSSSPPDPEPASSLPRTGTPHTEVEE